MKAGGFFFVYDQPLSRYADTSQTIHHQLGEKQIRTFPSVANILEETTTKTQKVTQRNCQTLPIKPSKRNFVTLFDLPYKRTRTHTFRPANQSANQSAAFKGRDDTFT
ncbi:hypothetical protein Phum_PHUM145560 [Pediculus humanus corporis]|uniref:Uncharacterized protein n=1 Tax=Pediculus humanus subsp. corporis TaxID=121224 RepID=E0VF32_PEDHC|nr:uncharacterized protein Phum_PHUM145560 [Pediculus humanus corporis]EEB11921.1 hypothetical protein Phum_PHUM145560 [Pediculus humanus corporis]